MAAGYNDVFSDHPGVWMKKKSISSEPVEPIYRKGFYSPTGVYHDGLYHVFVGNAQVEDIKYEKGLLYYTSEDLIFFDVKKYLLEEVVDTWGKNRLLEIDETIQEDAIRLDHPSIGKVSDTEWRLYYTLTDGSNASLIGYATSSSINGPWVDQGEVIASQPSYQATHPSYCFAEGKHYLAFGQNYKGKGVYLVELDEKTSKPFKKPQVII